MKELLWAEKQKLRHSKIIWITVFAVIMVAVIVFAQGQFVFNGSRYVDGAGWFMTASQSLATFYVLPAVIALLGSYMICREEQEDTMKSLQLIPVNETKLTAAKMIAINPFTRVVIDKHKSKIYLSAKEFDLLYFLYSHRGQVFSKEQLYENVWGYDDMPASSNLTSFIRKLRKKVEPDPNNPQYIITVWGVGYKFSEEKP